MLKPSLTIPYKWNWSVNLLHIALAFSSWKYKLYGVYSYLDNTHHTYLQQIERLVPYIRLTVMVWLGSDSISHTSLPIHFFLSSYLLLLIYSNFPIKCLCLLQIHGKQFLLFIYFDEKYDTNITWLNRNSLIWDQS